jgi:hypothetical protein
MQQHTALLVSLALEVPLVVALGVIAGRRDAVQVPWGSWALAGLAATLLTHPFAWWLNEEALRGVLSLWPRMAVIEVSVALVEGALFGWLCRDWLRGMLLSALANATSFGLGLLWFWFA